MEASESYSAGDGRSGQRPALRRGIGPTLLLFFILGDILGAGIYALVGEVGAVTGEPSGQRS